MIRTVLGVALAAAALAAQEMGGVRWETSFETARERAAREGRPVLLLEMFGRLDEELC